MLLKEDLNPIPQEQYSMGFSVFKDEALPVWDRLKGQVEWDLRWPDGDLIEHKNYDNLIVYDAGILIARLLKNSLVPVLGRSNGINMLAVGTGATGDLLNPDAPKKGQRRLNTEIYRKLVTAQFRTDPGGVAVSYPTHVVDFTATFGVSEANGPLNEMALLSAYDLSAPSPGNPILNGPDDYDSTVDVTSKDVLLNYLPFPVSSKPVGSILAITWRVTL